MALADVCGYKSVDFLQNTQFSLTGAASQQLKDGFCNFEENTKLSVPPYENVRLGNSVCHHLANRFRVLSSRH